MIMKRFIDKKDLEVYLSVKELRYLERLISEGKIKVHNEIVYAKG